MAIKIEIATKIGIEIQIQRQIEITINITIKSQPAVSDLIPPVHITIKIKNKIKITIATTIKMARKIAIQIMVVQPTNIGNAVESVLDAVSNSIPAIKFVSSCVEYHQIINLIQFCCFCWSIINPTIFRLSIQPHTASQINQFKISSAFNLSLNCRIRLQCRFCHWIVLWCRIQFDTVRWMSHISCRVSSNQLLIW